ncbi:CubicO group peptidase (beta-lactamase class C family) [Mycetocola sp. CAN_C7]|uniref:serine hydrolase domain-containing protein n=1 Tax=Mycetocola sp. CAN_C7 TaxID=2787724 RepID=UPI0018CBC0C6
MAAQSTPKSSTTDPELGALLTRRFGGRGAVAAAATVSPEGTRVAVLGVPTDADLEIGSISKGITGLLYADARVRGEVSGDTTLGEILPLGDSPAGSVSLDALSTHSSGLPRLAPDTQVLRRSVDLWRKGINPYGESLDELLAQARKATLAAPRPRYSNLGFELLGHAVATAAGLDYQQLLAERLVEPCGLSSVYAPSRPSELRQTAVFGRSRRGRIMRPWTGEAIAPAGGIRSSIGDLAGLVRALLDGEALGMDALDPVKEFSGGTRIGAAWLTLDLRGTQITWHNGGTGGFRSCLALDRRTGTGVVMVSGNSRPVDGHAFRLLQGLTGSKKRGSGTR